MTDADSDITRHAQLVALAARWLKRDHPLVITEMTAWESPDALGWKSSESTTLVECKASRADFLADAKKFFREHPEYGMGDRPSTKHRF